MKRLLTTIALLCGITFNSSAQILPVVSTDNKLVIKDNVMVFETVNGEYEFSKTVSLAIQFDVITRKDGQKVRVPYALGTVDKNENISYFMKRLQLVSIEFSLSVPEVRKEIPAAMVPYLERCLKDGFTHVAESATTFYLF